MMADDEESSANNFTLVDRLWRRSILGGKKQSMVLTRAFLTCDRSFFLPQSLSRGAFDDRPLRTGVYHQSAPHIYAAALADFDLLPTKAQAAPTSFLVVGSGTGYFCHLAGCVLGPKAMIHGVELNEELVGFARERGEAWRKGLEEQQAEREKCMQEEEEEEESTPK